MLIRVVLAGLLLRLCCSAVLVGAINSNSTIADPEEFRAAPSDLLALQELWRAWNNTPDISNNLAGWNDLADESMPPCDPNTPWRGVYCNARFNTSEYVNTNTSVWDLSIVGLSLTNSSLSGTIPPGIGNLSNLVTLSLTNNPELTGPLPLELENLISLFELDVHANSITGPGFPPWNPNTSFIFLQNLNMGDNKMTGELPDYENFAFRATQTLNFSYNLFTGSIYSDLYLYLQKAVSIDFSHNQFSGPLPNFVNFTDNDGNPFLVTRGPLSYVDLSSNKFNGTFPTASGHETIQVINASRNQLTGELNPALFFNISPLTTLDLSNNQLTGSIPNLNTLTSMQNLDLSYNNFDPGPFPNWTVQLNKLQILTLRGVSLTGDVPSSILAGFRSLQTLVLDNNSMTGTLDINSMLAVPNRSPSLEIVTLTNNNISNVAYSGLILNLPIKFNLLGNPYCDNSITPETDLIRCVCRQLCEDTPSAPGDEKIVIIATVTCASVVAVILLIGGWLLWRSRKERYELILGAEKKFAEYEVKPTIYTYAELQVITRFFSAKIGHGAFGAVYKGTLSNGSEVAVKQLFTKSQQSLDVFLNEIVLVAAVKHRNLVKLKGCCIRKDQRLLVYEYVENGDLEQFLFGQESTGKTLDWSVSKNICHEVAEGIHYLHFATQPKIIHRDIKASNILLDKNLEPKIADFGLAVLYPDAESHIMTIHVAGTRGYLAPEYAHLGQLSEKVDVFSFGVLLLEIVSRRRNIGPKTPEGQLYLPDWAWKLYSEGRIKELIGSSWELQPREETEAIGIISIALLCVHMSGERRPDMKALLAMLHGGMDAQVARLLAEHESDRFRSSRSTSGSVNYSDSGLHSAWLSRDESLVLHALEHQTSQTPLNVEMGNVEMQVQADPYVNKVPSP